MFSFQLIDPSRWQPIIEPAAKGLGKYKIQQFVTPQMGVTRPYTYKDPKQFEVPPHGR